MKKHLAKIYARYVLGKEKEALEAQKQTFEYLIKKGRNTLFGQRHNFENIKTYQDFKQNVPISNYEGLLEYVDKIKKGEKDVLWEHTPEYFAKTSGSTAGVKYIPLTKEQLLFQIEATKKMLLRYILTKDNADFVGGKMIFLQGSPKMDRVGKIKTGRLSGIVALHTPWYLKSNQLPSFKTNCIENWEEKLDNIIQETINADMTLISGIPSWLIMYFEKLVHLSGRKICELFPNLQLIVTGGVNLEPYKQKIYDLVGREIDILETYPASEGFIAATDSLSKDGSLRLCTSSGIFYEFIKADEFFDENPKRYCLEEVQIGINYAVIINSNAGLWGYAIGDTVCFTSLEPYRIKMTGRVSHFTSAFGEHVIGSEVENAISEACLKTGASVREFTLAPQLNPKEGKPYHQWFVEFSKLPESLDDFAGILNDSIMRQNVYYADLINGNILRNAVLTPVKEGTFNSYMKQEGKLGGQNKFQHLSNDRKIAEALLKIDSTDN